MRKMTTNQLKHIILVLLALPLTCMLLSGGSYWYLSSVFTRPIQKETSTGLITQKRDAKLTGDSYYIGSASYKGEISDKSKITKNENGKLLKISNGSAGISFITAVQDTEDTDSLAVNANWKIEQIGRDAMWIPGACAQKPSWLLQNRYVVVDDGNYEAGHSTHYYAVFDTQTNKFTHFGGSFISDLQQREKVLFVDVEDNKLVFYIDFQDETGKFAASSNFKHAKANHENFIVRRVINIQDLSYDDYRVPYQTPEFDVYYTKVIGRSGQVTLQLRTDGRANYLIGEIKPKQEVVLTKADEIKLQQLTSSSYEYNTSKIKSFQNDIREDIKAHVPSYLETIHYSGDNLDASYVGDAGKYMAVYLPGSGQSGGVPALYNTESKNISLVATDQSMKNWVDSGAFTLGIFE